MPVIKPVLATAVLRVKTGLSTFEHIRVLCDSGAQVNLLSEEAFRKLRLTREASRITLFGINDNKVATGGQVELDLWHRVHDHPIAKSQFVIIDNF